MTAAKSDIDLSTFSLIWRWWGQSKDPSKRAQLDEIRIGTSYLSVAP